ncbi:hypothetical protein BHM03_00045836 [Ensete ventricosum]|nr:hypothetical protein BHM03_00045836 [Ensete ventricosum]
MVSAECASSSTSVDGVAPDQVQFGISGASTSGGFPREPLELMAADEDLHRGLIGMGVPDVTSLMLNLRRGMTRHVALMARAVTVGLVRRLDTSTSNADMAAELTRT